MDDKVLKSGLRFELILPTVALVLYEGHLESILDLSGGTAWTWSGAPNWRGKCHHVSSSVHISLLICRVFDYWNINTTTWAIWKHILVGNFVLKEHLVILRSFPTRTGPGTTCASAGLNADWIQATYQHTEKAHGRCCQMFEAYFARAVLIERFSVVFLMVV